MKILIVDDELVSRKKLGFILRNLGECEEASNGEEALKITRSASPPDLVLLDVMMPGIDGYDVCTQLKKDEKTQDIPVIFISSLEETADEAAGFSCGAVDYIRKPFSSAIAKARVTSQLELKKHRTGLKNMVADRTKELAEAYEKLKDSHGQILQQEKLASIGQLAAGVAHEINNPTGFISSNLGTLAKYIERFDAFNKAQSQTIAELSGAEEAVAALRELRKKLKIDFISEDARDLVEESLEGTDRIKKIVMGLKNFSRKDGNESKLENINDCLENTLNIIWNELKYKATVKKDYGDLPPTTCFPQQLAQVFMNLLVNAAHAIEEQGTITIKTRHENGEIVVTISDTGCGISKDNLEKIFGPFFTTKEVGKGTGLGLSIINDIIQKHDGKIVVESEVGVGTTFITTLPVKE